MWGYTVRRFIYAIPILFCVNLITFLLFFTVNSPEDIARFHLGQKYVSQESIEQWKVAHGYNKPLFVNNLQSGAAKLTDTLFFTKSLKLFSFDFGESLQGRDISYDISQRMWPSLFLAIPTLILSMFLNIVFAMVLVFFRYSYLDTWGVIICVCLMSISSLFYIIGGQYLFAKMLQWLPISGYQPGIEVFKFLALPVIVAVLSNLGAGARWYRTLFLEEVNKDYVRTARAKGLPESVVLLKHVLKNAMIPILTGVVVILPTLFMGSLVMESFFGIPGLGSYTVDAIQQQDFDIVRAMVFLGTFLYIIGLILTDFSYVLVDPRVRIK